MLNQFQMFDSHFHIIDKRFPLIINNGYLPEEFTCKDYLEKNIGLPTTWWGNCIWLFSGFRSKLFDLCNQGTGYFFWGVLSFQ